MSQNQQEASNQQEEESKPSWSKYKRSQLNNFTIKFGKGSFSFKDFLTSTKGNHKYQFRCKCVRCRVTLTIPYDIDIGKAEFTQEQLKRFVFKQQHKKDCTYLEEPSNQKQSQNEEKMEIHVLGQSFKKNLDLLNEFFKSPANTLKKPNQIKREFDLENQNFTIQEIKNMRNKAIDVHFPKFDDESLNPILCSTIPLMNNEDPQKFMQLRFEAHSTNKKGQIYPMKGIILASDWMIGQLKNRKSWFVDGTFTVAPKAYQQILTVIVPSKFNDQEVFLPACHILLSNKSEELYNLAFSDLKFLYQRLYNEELQVQYLMADFELALRNSIRKIFSIEENNMHGCFFHYVQCLWNKCTKIGLKTHKNIKMIIFLMKLYAHVPQQKESNYRKKIWNQILEVAEIDQQETTLFEYSEEYKAPTKEEKADLKQNYSGYDTNSKLCRFLLYFKNEWMNSYEVNLSSERTNNICESYHSKLWRQIATFSPRLSVVIKYFIEEEFLSRKLVSQLSTGFFLAANEIKNEQDNSFYKLQSKLISLTDSEILEKYLKTSENEIEDEMRMLLTDCCNTIIGSNLTGLQEDEVEEEEEKDKNQQIEEIKVTVIKKEDLEQDQEQEQEDMDNEIYGFQQTIKKMKIMNINKEITIEKMQQEKTFFD